MYHNYEVRVLTTVNTWREHETFEVYTVYLTKVDINTDNGTRNYLMLL